MSFVVQIIDRSQRDFDRDCGIRRMQVQRTNFMFSERCERPIQRFPDSLLSEIAVLAGIHSVRNMQYKSGDCGGVGKPTLCQRRSFRGSSGPKTARYYELTNGLAQGRGSSNLFGRPSPVETSSVDRIVAAFCVAVHD